MGRPYLCSDRGTFLVRAILRRRSNLHVIWNGRGAMRPTARR